MNCCGVFNWNGSYYCRIYNNFTTRNLLKMCCRFVDVTCITTFRCCWCFTSLQWRHDERDSVSNYRRFDRLLRRLFRHRSKKTSQLRVTGLCEGNSPVTPDGFPSHRVSNAEKVSIWLRHHVWFSSVYIDCRHMQHTEDKIRDHTGLWIHDG